MFPQIRPTRALIHASHLVHNLKLLKNLVPAGRFFCPMIKANAYGHGDIDVSKILAEEGISSVGVGLVEEGIFLREAQFTGQIIVFGTFHSKSLVEMVKYNLTPVVSSWDCIKALQELRVDRMIPVHVKFDTGMHRLGFQTHEASKVLQALMECKQIKIQGVLTHFFQGSDFAQAQGSSRQQLKQFASVFPVFESTGCHFHALNSASLIAAQKAQLSAEEKSWLQKLGARPGISLYGSSQEPIGLKPVMSFRSAVVQYHQIQKGDTVSYSGTWKASRDSVIGVVPAGYADGVHRILSNKGHVLYRGKKVSMIGNVCMDYFMIDVTDGFQPSQNSVVANPDEHEVTIFGFDSNGVLNSADDLAVEAQTISYEILTSISERVPKMLDFSQHHILEKPA